MDWTREIILKDFIFDFNKVVCMYVVGGGFSFLSPRLVTFTKV